MIVDKEKQQEKQMQDKEVFLYKFYNIPLHKSKTPKTTSIQDEIKNLDKYMKYMQLSVKTMLFYLLPHYKSIHPQGE